MVIASKGSKKAIYFILILASVLIAVDIWYVTNVLNLRQVGYLLWEGGISILLLLVGTLLSFSFTKDSRTRTGIIITYCLLIFEVLIMLNYATIAPQVEKLTFYFHLSITASAILLIGMVGNIVGVEKKQEEGFNIHVYDSKSPIPPKLLIPLWIVVFLIMGAFVFTSGHVLISYPQFGIIPWLGGPATSGFGVGDWENVCFMILPFAISMLILRKFKVPILPSVVISLIVGTVVFTVYHTLVYSTNMIAMIMVLIFGTASLIIYRYTKSIIIISAMHVGNNFWGALFAVTVIGLAAFGGSPVILIGASVILIVGAAISIFVILKLVKKYGK